MPLCLLLRLLSPPRSPLQPPIPQLMVLLHRERALGLTFRAFLLATVLLTRK